MIKVKSAFFLGVSEHSKAYKLYNPITKKIVISRDVVFNEENTWNWGEKSTGQQQIPVNFDEEDTRENDQQVQPLIPSAIEV